MERTPLKDKPITQIGLVVDDIERTAQAWADVLGVEKPEIIITDPVEIAHTQYRGKPTTARQADIFSSWACYAGINRAHQRKQHMERAS